MLKSPQKMLLHIYADAARLDDPTYRSYLREHAGVSSAADRGFSQHGFDCAMAALETVLFERVHRGMVTNPQGKSHYIHTETHWRDKLPRHGHINTRQVNKINELWTRLQEYLLPEQCTQEYFEGIIHQSTHREIELYSLGAHQAGYVIDALKDRLYWALKQSAVCNLKSEIPLEEVPF
jgi:hypothetical protein